MERSGRAILGESDWGCAAHETVNHDRMNHRNTHAATPWPSGPKGNKIRNPFFKATVSKQDYPRQWMQEYQQWRRDNKLDANRYDAEYAKGYLKTIKGLFSRKAGQMNTNARQRGYDGQVTSAALIQIWRLQGGRVHGSKIHAYDDAQAIEQQPKCAFCGERLDTFQARGFMMDHKIPMAYGGKNAAENVHFLCEACEKKKTQYDLHFRSKYRLGKTYLWIDCMEAMRPTPSMQTIETKDDPKSLKQTHHEEIKALKQELATERKRSRRLMDTVHELKNTIEYIPTIPQPPKEKKRTQIYHTLQKLQGTLDLYNVHTNQTCIIPSQSTTKQ